MNNLVSKWLRLQATYFVKYRIAAGLYGSTEHCMVIDVVAPCEAAINETIKSKVKTPYDLIEVRRLW